MSALPASRSQRAITRIWCLLLALCLTVSGCATAKPPQAQTRRALEPAGFSHAVVTEGYDLAVVRYEPGGGFDYSSTPVMPVLLALKNKGPGQPQVITEDVRAITPEGDYLPYTTFEAARLAASSKAFSQGAKDAVKDGAVGAVIGGGLGVLLGVVLGVNPSYLWRGAAVGAATGAAVGAISSLPQSRAELGRAITADLDSHAWHDDPVAPGTTRLGYFYLPAGLGIESIRVLVRTENGDTPLTLSLDSPKEYNHHAARSAAAQPRNAAPASPGPNPSPADAPQQDDLPKPKRAPGWSSI